MKSGFIWGVAGGIFLLCEFTYPHCYLWSFSELNARCLLIMAPVPEYRVWHRAPQNALAYTFGRRIVPGLIVAAEITKEWSLVADTLKWFNTEWLPKAEAAAGVARMISRVDSRTLPVDDIFSPLIDEFRERFYCIVYYLWGTYPELPIRVRG